MRAVYHFIVQFYVLIFRIPNISQEIKASLGDYSAEDIENKLIPFKKRQFNELQFEEIKLKKQIEKAKSQSNTPRRLSDSSDQLRSPPQLMIASSPPEPEEDDKRVSPLKLSLRGVVIQQPSSSSSSAEVMAERITVTDHSESHLKQDDNAMFPEQRLVEEQVQEMMIVTMTMTMIMTIIMVMMMMMMMTMTIQMLMTVDVDVYVNVKMTLTMTMTMTMTMIMMRMRMP